MALILFDTNIFIDMLGGCQEASAELNAYDEPAISVITYMELYSGAIPRPYEKAQLEALLATFILLHIDQDITDKAILIRGNSLVTLPKIKLPDAIIGATAARWNIPLVTRNLPDFYSLSTPVHVPYDYNSKTGVVTNVRRPYVISSAPTLQILR